MAETTVVEVGRRGEVNKGVENSAKAKEEVLQVGKSSHLYMRTSIRNH